MEQCSLCKQPPQGNMVKVRVQFEDGCAILQICAPCIEKISAGLQAIVESRSDE